MRAFEIPKEFADMLDAPEYPAATALFQQLWAEQAARRRMRKLQEAIDDEGCGPVFAALTTNA